MALRETTVNLNMRGGLDKKTDQRLVIPSKLTVADNVEFFDSDTIVRRYGLKSRTMGGSFAQTPVRMFEHGVPHIEIQDGTVLRATSGGVASPLASTALSNEVSKFARYGLVTSRVQSLVTKSTLPAAGVPLYDRNFDVAVGTSTYMVVWEGAGYNGRGAIYCSIRSLTTDDVLWTGVFSATGAATDIYVKPRALYDSTNARFAVFYAHFLSGSTNFDVDGFYIPAAATALPTSFTGLVAAAGAGAVEGAVGLEALFDVAVSAGNGYGVVARNTNGNVFMRSLNLSLGALCATANAAPATPIVSLTAHATFSAGVLTTHALYGAGANLRGFRQPSNTGVMTAEATITTVAGSLVGRVAVVDFGGGLYIVCDTFTATTSVFATSYLVSCSTAHVFTSRTPVATNTFIAGRIFSMRSRLYIPTIFTSQQFQSTTLLLDVTAASANLGSTTAATPYYAARIDPWECANPSPLAVDSAHRVPNAAATFLPYLKYETNTRLAGVANVTTVAIARAKLDDGQLADAKWNGDTYLAGACPLVYDGVSMVEEGFHWAPEIVGTVTNGLVAITPVATGTGSFSFPAPAAYPATYTVAFTESWQDAQGNWHESGVAFLGSVTLTGAGNLDINPTIIRPPTLKTDPKLTLYRTLPSSTNTTLYLAHRTDLGSGVGYVNDTDLPNGEPLYTEGGVLSNTPAPSCRHIIPFNDRLVISGCGDGSRVYWSKTKATGFAAEFVLDDVSFQQVVPPALGRAVGTAELLGKIVVVCEKGVGAIYGQGPDATGTQGGFAPLETASLDIGADWASPKCVIRSAEGVWFRSSQGLRLFNGGSIARDQSGKFIGSEIDALLSTSPVVALAGSDQQVRFFATTIDQAFVWDQTWGQFTRWTNHQCVDAVNAESTYFIVSNTLVPNPLLRYRSNVMLDVDDTGTANDAFEAYIETAWLQFGGVQGFQRVYRMVALGQMMDLTSDRQSVRILVAYDYVDDMAVEVNSQVDPYGAGSAVGRVQVEHQFHRQKCEALKIGFAMSPDFAGSGTTDGRLRLTDFALSVGVKKGPYREAGVV